MNPALSSLLKKPAMNQWRLFWLVFIPLSAWVLWNFIQTHTTTGPGISSMISVSVRGTQA